MLNMFGFYIIVGSYMLLYLGMSSSTNSMVNFQNVDLRNSPECVRIACSDKKNKMTYKG